MFSSPSILVVILNGKADRKLHCLLKTRALKTSTSFLIAKEIVGFIIQNTSETQKKEKKKRKKKLVITLS